jgi:hypothetical protein
LEVKRASARVAGFYRGSVLRRFPAATDPLAPGSYYELVLKVLSLGRPGAATCAPFSTGSQLNRC